MSTDIKSQLWNLSFKRTHMRGVEFRKLLAQAASEIKRLELEVERLNELMVKHD